MVDNVNIDNQSKSLSYKGNTKYRGRLSAVDLLINAACFAKKKIMFAVSKTADLN